MQSSVIALALVLGQPDDAFFEAKIRPVLVESCFKCHGGKKTSNGLRVDSREALLKVGDSGPAIVPGSPEKSLLIQAIRYTGDELKMPPDKKLPDAVVADFTRWIKDGAIWPKKVATGFQAQKHWAFEPVKRVTPPADPTGWADNSIDQTVGIGNKTPAVADRNLPVGSGDEAMRHIVLRK